MALYEMRTYTLYVGKLDEAVKHYQELGWPALQKGGYDQKLVGYFTTDVGTLNKLVHLWKFDDDADRRNHWGRLFQDDDFMAFAKKIRPLILTQENQLMQEADHDKRGCAHAGTLRHQASADEDRKKRKFRGYTWKQFEETFDRYVPRI